MLKNVIVALLIILLTIQTVGADEPIKNSILLTLPKLEWALDVNMADLVLSRKEIDSDCNSVYFLAHDIKTGVTISGLLEEHPKSATAKECMDFYWARVKESPYKKDDVVQSSFGDMATVEHMIKEHEGIKINQKHINAYLTKDKFWMYIHLSKVDYKESDKKLFDSVLNNIKIVNKKQGHKVRVNYQIANQGVLKLDVLANWHDEIWQKSENSPADIILTPSLDSSSKVLITVMWDKKGEGVFNSPQKIKKFVEKSGKKALLHAVENSLEIREIKRASHIGYFYTLTDKAPEPGGYKYMTQGAYSLEKFFLVFTILTNEKDSEVSKAALDMIADSEEKRDKVPD